mmetsp:Transcript_15893/g.18275  ORF Transcript_15893/g.18275 Transcript_15893/m.18275 type:complete len:230 (-) Transcript_15893:1043-1732(-)
MDKMKRFSAVLFLAWRLLSVKGNDFDCASSLSLSQTDLLYMRTRDFVPMAYFEGEGSKFISSTGDQTVDMGKLCVDGGASYSGPIQLYDDGTHGDDFAGDNIFTRECVHFCTVDINFEDYFGFAMEEKINNARLIVVDASLKGTVPYEAVDTPLTPDTKAIASSHAFFFADFFILFLPPRTTCGATSLSALMASDRPGPDKNFPKCCFLIGIAKRCFSSCLASCASRRR